MSALDLLTGDAQAFCDKVWASHVHVHHGDDELARMLSMEAVDSLLTSVALRTPALRVVRDGTVLPPASFTRAATIAGTALTGLVDAPKVLDLYDGGATVVLQGLHRYHSPLTRLVRELELALGHPCQANAYLTPPGAQGFAKHSDTHDVFVFQTHGHKLWEIDDEELLLEVGTSVYLPAGTPHAARTQDVPSLHVTIGVNQLTWRSLLSDVSAEVLADPAYDEHLPAAYLGERDRLTEPLAERLATFVESLASVVAADVVDSESSRFLVERTPLLDGGLLDRTLLDTLHGGSLLERRATSACDLVPDGDRLRVLLGDREVRMPAHLLEAMQVIRERASFRPEELPLDPHSAEVLTRRLVREGLLRIVR